MRELEFNHACGGSVYSLIALFAYGHGRNPVPLKVIISPDRDDVEGEMDYQTLWFESESAMREDPDYLGTCSDDAYVGDPGFVSAADL